MAGFWEGTGLSQAVFCPQPSSPSRALVTDLFLTDVIAYYARMGTQPVCFQVHSVKVGGTLGTAPGCH